MDKIKFLEESIKKWWTYLKENSEKIQNIIQELQEDSTLSEKNRQILEYMKLVLENLSYLKKNKIFRGIYISDYSKQRKINNYTSSFNEASLYWSGVVLGYYFDYNNEENIEEEAIVDRKTYAHECDPYIKKKKLNWMKWYVWEGNYFYRLKKDTLSLSCVYYTQDTLERNLYNIIQFSKKFLKISRQELRERLQIEEKKMKKWEDEKEVVTIDDIKKITSLLPIEQKIKINNTYLQLK